jgi:hypothetical protein
MPVTAVRRRCATRWRRALPVAATLLLGACAARLPAVTEGPAPEGSATPGLPFDDAALSADGRLLVRRAGEGITRIDVAPSEARDAPPPGRGALALAPTGALAAVVSEARPAELVLLETSSGREVRRIEASRGEAVVTFAFSRDGRSLVIATASGVERRSVSDGRRLAAWATPGVLALTPLPSADDAIVITGERRRRPFVALLRDRQRRPRRLPIDGVFAPQRIAVSADGRWLAIASYDAAAPRPRPVLARRAAHAARARALAIWDLTTMTPTPGAPPLERFDGASALAFAPDDRLVASVGSPCNGEHERLIVWSLTRAELLLDRPLRRLDDLRVVDGAILGADDETLLRVDPRSGEVTTLRSCGDDGSCRIVLCG